MADVAAPSVFSPLHPPQMLPAGIDEAPEADDAPRVGELEETAFQPYKAGFPVWSLQPTSGAPPRRACCMSAVRHNEKFYVFGGGVIKKIYSELYEYDIAAKTWRMVETTGECAPAMLSHTAVLIGDEMLIYGGMGQSSCYDDVYALNLNSFTWRRLRPVAGRAPQPRKGHTAVAHGGKMWVAMGAEYLGGIFNDMHCFDPKTLTWEVVCSDAPHTDGGRPAAGRTGHTAVIVGDEMLLVGGMTMTATVTPNGEEPKSVWMNDVHGFNFVTKKWRLVSRPEAEVTPPGRYSHASWVAGDSLYIFGGDAQDCASYFNDLWRFNLKSRGWEKVETTGDAPAARSGHAAVTHAGEVFLFGGERPSQPSSPTTPLADTDVEYSNCIYRLPLFIARDTTLTDVVLRFCVQQRMLGTEFDGVPSSVVSRLREFLPRSSPVTVHADDGCNWDSAERPVSVFTEVTQRPFRPVPALAALPLALPTMVPVAV